MRPSLFSDPDAVPVLHTRNPILELEFAGLMRYLHDSCMIFGHTRIPILASLRAQANEAQAHATLTGVRRPGSVV